jgi:WD40 repeat protein
MHFCVLTFQRCFQIASSDHDAVVTVWDTVHGKMAMELEEHEKRVWSVDYNPADAHTLVSGGDDGKVRVRVCVCGPALRSTRRLRKNTPSCGESTPIAPR